MGIDTKLGTGNTNTEQELRENIYTCRDNGKLLGIIATGSAVFSVALGIKYGADSGGSLLFAIGTWVGGAMSLCEISDAVGASRDLNDLISLGDN